MKAGDRLLILSATLLTLLVFLQALLVLTTDYADKKVEPTSSVRCDVCGHKIDINEPYVCQGTENHWHAECYLNKVQKEKNDEKITEYAA